MTDDSAPVQTEPPRRVSRDPYRAGAWVVVLLALLFAGLVRARLLSVPFERDEGEYAYAGQLILQGIPPYRMVYNMKLPGTYAAYAIVMALFGQTVRGVHLGLLVVNAAAIVLVFLLGRRLFGSFAGAVAAAGYALLSLSQTVLGVFAHATHFVILPALAGLLLLLRGIDSGRLRTLLGSGLLLGLAFLMKQHGIFFVIFGLLYFAWEKRRASWRRFAVEGGVLALGAALPLGLTCLILAASGVFGNFWFWTFHYATAYVAEVPLAVLPIYLPAAFAMVTATTMPIWDLAGLGLLALFLREELRDARAFVVGFLLFSFLAVCPGFYFRPHYFVLLLPAVALLAGLAVDALRRLLSETSLARAATTIPALLFLAVCVVTIHGEANFFFHETPLQASRATYGPSPFPEAVEIAKHIRERTTESDRIAILGSEPEIFFYAGRKSATGYIYMYGLTEKQDYAATMQQEAVREIEASAPLYLVFVNVFSSWGPRPDKGTPIFDWYQKYVADHFDLTGLVDIVSQDETDYAWGRDASGRAPRSNYYLYVYRRKSP